MLVIIGAILDGSEDDSSNEGDGDSAAVAGETTTPTESEPSKTQAPKSRPTKPAQTKPRPTSSVTPKPSRPPRTRTTPTPTQPEPPPVRFYPVTEVVDGDTVKVARNGETSIRIIGIDTPETVDPSAPVECGGPRASVLASQLLTGKAVRLVFDPSQGRLDAYGRTLAYLQVRGGPYDFGLAMIQRGAAAEYTYDTAYARQAQYQSAEAQARAAGRGLWGICGGPHVAPTTAPPPPATTVPPPPTVVPPPTGGGCASGYSPCVPPYPPDVDCNDVNGPITVTGDDPHGLDADKDGIACES